jgi:hypothetical protein
MARGLKGKAKADRGHRRKSAVNRVHSPSPLAERARSRVPGWTPLEGWSEEADAMTGLKVVIDT